MKNLIIAAFTAASLLAGPGAIVTATSALAACDANAPDAWKRPGGFCDQMGGGSLSKPVPAGPEDGCYDGPVVLQEIAMLEKGARIHVAADCGGCVDLAPAAYGGANQAAARLQLVLCEIEVIN